MNETAFQLLNPEQKQKINGSICRVFRNKNYTTMSNIHLRDKNLSLKAKGLLSLVLSLPENWNYTIAGLVSIVQEGEFAVRNILKELQQHKYLVIKKINPNAQTKVLSYQYMFFEAPEDYFQDITNQDIDHQDIGNQPLENQWQINKEQQLTEQTKIDNNKKTIQKSQQDLKNRPEEQDNVFNSFWSQYPKQRRGSKQKAYRAWISAQKREGISGEQILATVQAYANSEEVAKGYAKGCEAWLNGSCFFNEYKSANTSKSINPILEHILKDYESAEISQNAVLRERYIKQHSSSADELLNACEGNVEQAKQMIKYYSDYIFPHENKQQWFLWDVLNNFCRIHDALKYRKGGRTW